LRTASGKTVIDDRESSIVAGKTCIVDLRCCIDETGGCIVAGNTPDGATANLMR